MSQHRHRLSWDGWSHTEQKKSAISSDIWSVTWVIWVLTSLQSPLSDFMAENAQTCPIVGSHLNFIVSPDDEVLQQQIGHIWAGNVLDLVVHRQPSETVPLKSTAQEF